MRPYVTITDESSAGEIPNAGIMAVARLVCEHGTVLWVSFGDPPLDLRTQESDAERRCRCVPHVAAIYPDAIDGFEPTR